LNAGSSRAAVMTGKAKISGHPNDGEIVSTAVIPGGNKGSERFMDLRSITCARWRTRGVPLQASSGGYPHELAVRSYGHRAGPRDVISQRTLVNHDVLP